MPLDVRTLYCKIANSRYDSKSHAFWPNDPTLHLGDYGMFDGTFFDRQGNVFEDGVVTADDCPSVPPHVTTTDEIFAYGCQYGLKAGGEVANAVTVQIDFASNESLLIYTHNLKTSSLNGLNNLQRKLIDRLTQRNWDRQLIVVTELVTAEQLHYYAYAGGKGTIDLKANVSPDTFNIKHDFGQLTITANAGISTELFHESTYSNGVVFLYKAKRLVRPILDLLGNPRLEVQAAANEFSADTEQYKPSSANDLILGDV